ncbi:MAG TPA: saccharopine dehydrogenase NADP-binding domain-containing protein [Syntrophobacteraceae bacterium]|nr:saccharopine dehydrogenase NADP-binding domain-containing protein [Syntrophobacteraceae bacterium]
MKNDILVVGGYGQVGRIISSRLAREYPGRVVIAGRNALKDRAQADPAIRRRQLDLAHPAEFSPALAGVRLAVVSFERKNSNFVQTCIEQGVCYIEVAASHEKLCEVTALGDLALEKGVAVIPGAGLIPGLSNILAAHCADGLTSVKRVDIFAMLGLGDLHGIDAIRWILDHGGRRFALATRRGTECFESFSDPRPVRFPDENTPRIAYRFNFGDQHVLTESIGADEAASRVCFDSGPATRLFVLAARAGVLRLARRLSPLRIARMMQPIRFGSNRFGLLVAVTDEFGVRVDASVTGRGEAKATGVVTALAARLLYDGKVRPGVHFLEHVLPLSAIKDDLEAEGIRVWADTPPEGGLSRRPPPAPIGSTRGPGRNP